MSCTLLTYLLNKFETKWTNHLFTYTETKSLITGNFAKEKIKLQWILECVFHTADQLQVTLTVLTFLGTENFRGQIGHTLIILWPCLILYQPALPENKLLHKRDVSRFIVSHETWMDGTCLHLSSLSIYQLKTRLFTTSSNFQCRLYRRDM